MRLAPSSLLLVLAACASAPAGPPEDVAREIVVALERDRPDRADELFARADDAGEDAMYPVLWDAARHRYEQGDAGSASRLLGFMAEHYPGADGVRKAHVYALFQERARSPEADPELVDRTGRALADLRARTSDVPAWVELAEAQHEIDRGRPDEARAAFARFLDAWDGQPEEMWTYVEDVERWLLSH